MIENNDDRTKDADIVQKTVKRPVKESERAHGKMIFLLIVIGALAGGIYWAQKNNITSFVQAKKAFFKQEIDPANKEQWSYAFGQRIGTEVATSVTTQYSELFTSDDLSEKIVMQAIADALKQKDLRFTEEELEKIFTDRGAMEIKRISDENIEAEKKLLGEYLQDADVVTSDNGLLYKVITEGTGALVGTSIPLAHYAITLPNGTEMMNSKTMSEEPIPFDISADINTLAELVSTMRVGDEREIVVPANKAYGAEGVPGAIPPYQTLIFKITITGIQE